MPVTRASPSIKVKAIERWVLALPLANEQQTATALVNFISNMNQTAYPLAKRFKALEVLQSTIQQRLGNLYRNSHSNQWPPSERIQQYYSIAKSLLNTVSTGYQICVVDLLEQTGSPSRRALATCVQRSQQALGQILELSYKKYTSSPQGLWYNIHQLYLIARSFNCKDRSVKNIESLSPGYSSVAFEYKKQILLEIANPSHLLNSQISELVLLAEDWAHDLKLELLSEGVADSTFVIDPLSDSQPLRNSVAQKLNIDPMYSVNISILSKRLLKTLQAGKNDLEIPGTAKINPSGTLLKLLLGDWLRYNKRIYKRTIQKATLQITMGLTNSFNFISNSLDTKKNKNPQKTNLALQDTQGQLSTAYNQKQFDGNISQYIATIKHNRSQVVPLPSEKIHLHHCKVLNVSATGYCLQRKDKTTTSVQIGDVIALHEPHNVHAPHSSIGVVRWLRYNSNDGLSLGIQVLSPKAQALRTAYKSGDRNTFLPGLALPEVPALQQASSLLTLAQRYHVGERVEITKGHQKIKIKLGERLERNQGYDRFKYEILANK